MYIRYRLQIKQKLRAKSGVKDVGVESFLNQWQCYNVVRATQQLSNFVSVQKRLGMNKFVRTKSPTGSKFSKSFLEI